MRKLAVAVPFMLVIAACGADTKSCTTKPADVAVSGSGAPRVGACSAAAGTTVNIPVGLCASCSDSSPSCNAEFRNNAIEIDPIFRECAEDRSCGITGSCENDPSKSSTTCSVAIPAGVSGTIPVILAATATQVSTVSVGSSSGCSFAVEAAPPATP